jgi:hypothetical protein
MAGALFASESLDPGCFASAPSTTKLPFVTTKLPQEEDQLPLPLPVADGW